MAETNGWKESAKYVEAKIESLAKEIIELREQNVELRIEMAVVKTMSKGRNGLWGLLGGLVPSLSALIYIILKSKN